MATIDVKDAAGTTQTLERPLAPGQAAMAASRPVVIANNQSAVPISGTVTVNGVSTTAADRGAGAATAQTLRTTIDTGQLGALVAGGVPVVSGGFEYETVAAGQTDQIMGATGAVGDYIEGILCVVATAATSQVQIKDGNGSAITVQPNAVGAGVGSYYVPLGLVAINATTPGWKITTAAGVSVLATGNFT